MRERRRRRVPDVRDSGRGARGSPCGPKLPVIACEVDYGGRVGPRWLDVRVQIREDAPAVREHQVGVVGVDHARLLIGDADSLSHWQYEAPIDGLADTVYWGASAEEVRAVVGGEPGGDGTFGWRGLDWDTALRRGLELEEWKRDHPAARLGIDFRPHSHHWAVLEQARASEHGVGELELGGAEVLMFFTSWGDGLYPVVVENAADGQPVAVRIQLGDEDRRARTEQLLT